MPSAVPISSIFTPAMRWEMIHRVRSGMRLRRVPERVGRFDLGERGIALADRLEPQVEHVGVVDVRPALVVLAARAARPAPHRVDEAELQVAVHVLQPRRLRSVRVGEIQESGERLRLDFFAQTEDPMVPAVRADDQLGERNRLFDEFIAVRDGGGGFRGRRVGDLRGGGDCHCQQDLRRDSGARWLRGRRHHRRRLTVSPRA